MLTGASRKHKSAKRNAYEKTRRGQVQPVVVMWVCGSAFPGPGPWGGDSRNLYFFLLIVLITGLIKYLQCATHCSQNFTYFTLFGSPWHQDEDIVIIIPILHMKKLTPREIKQLAQIFHLGKWQSEDLK